MLTKLYCEIGDCKALFNVYTHIFFMSVFIFSSSYIYIAFMLVHSLTSSVLKTRKHIYLL